MLYCAHHGAGHADYTFTEYPELENALLEKLDVDHNGKLDSTDVFLMMYYVACNGAGIPVHWEDLIYLFPISNIIYSIKIKYSIYRNDLLLHKQVKNVYNKISCT